MIFWNKVKAKNRKVSFFNNNNYICCMCNFRGWWRSYQSQQGQSWKKQFDRVFWEHSFHSPQHQTPRMKTENTRQMCRINIIESKQIMGLYIYIWFILHFAIKTMSNVVKKKKKLWWWQIWSVKVSMVSKMMSMVIGVQNYVKNDVKKYHWCQICWCQMASMVSMELFGVIFWHHWHHLTSFDTICWHH